MLLVCVLTILYMPLIIILEYNLSTHKGFAVKQYALFCWQQPHTFHVYCVFRLHHFLLCLI